MRRALIAGIIGITVFCSALAYADKPPTRWGLGLGGEFSDLVTSMPGTAPRLGAGKLTGIFSVGNPFSLDLSLGFVLAGNLQTPNPAYLMAQAEGFWENSDRRYGATIESEFSLATETIFSEQRLLVGPTVEFKYDDSRRIKVTAGYLMRWMPEALSFGSGFGIGITGEYMPED